MSTLKQINVVTFHGNIFQTKNRKKRNSADEKEQKNNWRMHLRMSAKCSKLQMRLQKQVGGMDEVHARGLSCLVHVRAPVWYGMVYGRARLREGRGRAKGRDQLLIRGLLLRLLTMMDDHMLRCKENQKRDVKVTHHCSKYG